jgi:hypothetical protein
VAAPDEQLLRHEAIHCKAIVSKSKE